VLHIDGSEGEGGGQVLRTSLALSALTGTPFQLDRLRAGRDRPGLQRQHLTGVRAVAAICGATVTGDALGSTSLSFVPATIRPGRYRFDVGTAGSLGLVLQAVLPVLWSAGGPSSLELIGGTLNDRSPPAPFLQRTLLPLLGELGPKVTLTVERHGFYPAGGGRYTVDIAPAPLGPLRLPHRGPIEWTVAVAVVSNLPRSVGERELRTLARRVPLTESRVEEVAANGPGNAVWIEAHTPHVTEVFTGFGRRGTPAEKVAEEAAAEFLAWEAIGAPVGPHLADQLLLPLALAGAGSFRTGPLTGHTTTNLAVIQRFLDVDFAVQPVDGQVSVSVSRRGAA
jgi:RNA 3'-terminal phosphate cyclase (ATP)